MDSRLRREWNGVNTIQYGGRKDVDTRHCTVEDGKKWIPDYVENGREVDTRHLYRLEKEWIA